MRQLGRSARTRLLIGASAVAILCSAGAAMAQDKAPITIAPQPLASALYEFGGKTGTQVIFASTLASAKQTGGVAGESDQQVALAQLLAGTGLTFKRDGDTFVILAAEGGSDPQSSGAAGDGAEGTVEALIVTAQKREEDIQDVPIAISAFTQEDLTRSQVAGGPDLMTQVPNFTFTKTNFTGYSIQIRGIGTQAISATTDPAVAVAFNNTPFIRNRFFEQEFFDLQRVEVLRGPQGTLYGRNATAGVVNIISAKPSFQFEAKASADISNYNSSRIEGMLNLPLVADAAALRIAGAWTKRDGYVKNLVTGEQIDGRDLWSGRLSLRLTPVAGFEANLIYEHFQESDDRLRSSKQLCHKDLGPAEVLGMPVLQTADPVFAGPVTAAIYSQGCKPASLYSPDSFQTPNGFALPYYGAPAGVGAPVYETLDPYINATQSRDLREIETHLRPNYEASTDTVELQLSFDLTPDLTLTSETGFLRDHIFSFEDYNRFDTTPGVFQPGRNIAHPDGSLRYDIINENGVFCDPQLACTNRLAAGDLSEARSQQFSQELRLSSNFDGPVNFNLGSNWLRYDTEDKYYVFINSLTAYLAGSANPFDPNDSWPNDNAYCYGEPNTQQFDMVGYVWSNPDVARDLGGCPYIDPNDIHNLNDQGRNYFLSKNPYQLLSYSVFGEVYWQVMEDLKVTLGLRYTNDHKQAPQVPSWLLAGNITYGTPTRKVIDLEWGEPTGRLAVDWKAPVSFTDETLLYASYVRGYKAGGANPPPAIPVFPPVGGITGGDPIGQAIVQESLTHPETFDPEFVDAFEVGTKNTLLDGRLTFNLNGFYYAYKGYQISQIVDRSAVNLNFDADIWGSELEVDWRPLENLRLGFKGGYENTKLADGSRAIDLMDRSAGMEGWIVERPFPTFPSNCVVPLEFTLIMGCEGYKLGTDPVSGLPFDPVTGLPYVENPQFIRAANGDIVPLNMPDYPGFDTRLAPNNGEGFAKDISGNQLPNAPKYTLTATADYTVPLPADWLMTLHTDLYMQSEAWTRVFNAEGYDKLKAYTNVNIAAIFSNEDAGWQVMAYVKNIFDKDNVTGSFLNSDDTGLTTNVFLNEPRLYGLRVTKSWTGSEWWSARANKSGYYPYRLELMGDYGRIGGGREIIAPATALAFPDDSPYPLGVQNDLDWASGGGVKLTYQSEPNGWSFSGGVRYGRANGDAEGHSKWSVPGGLLVTQEKYDQFKDIFPPSAVAQLHFNPTRNGWYNYATATAETTETHAMADFMVGRDVGLGGLRSHLGFGLQYAHFNADSQALLHGRPDLAFPEENISKYGGHMHRFHADLEAHRQFDGAGPAVNWDASIPLRALGDAGDVSLDVGVGASVLFGRQTAETGGYLRGGYYINIAMTPSAGERETVGAYDTSLAQRRSKAITVPSLNGSLGVSYAVQGLKLSTGYRWERYYDAIDGGLFERKTFDRQFDGPYVKVTIGFGG